MVGKTDKSYIKEAVDVYTKRLVHYIPFEIQVIPDIKNVKKLSTEQLKQKEGELILNALSSQAELILLDEGGKDFSSKGFSKLLEKKMISGTRQLCFVIGGAYGFSDDVYKKALIKFSLSKMTFSHQMVRMIFVEQLYRAFTIIKGEPYHHE
ncbi:Ribosomal RNA large subunit methyltransferase H [Candidatus Venteria ishoeyi]|uniref:Ribosomal RNA large subunit methyltransferase H n=2 Tax=Candidatus Venteria ishoeyi TaxID=1899563 RepID=A0A1H6F7L9_9GAMM|nr:Ribosomal RNA large subunit methyltransferase H [Candidatus Venteria ishoeyi]